jgi:hypothetical protein
MHDNNLGGSGDKFHRDAGSRCIGKCVIWVESELELRKVGISLPAPALAFSVDASRWEHYSPSRSPARMRCLRTRKLERKHS